MKRLLFAIIVLALGWAGYWFIGSTAVTRSFEAWFEDRQEDGWVAEVANIRTRGFPNRFDTTLTDVTLADPDTGLAYDVPFLQIFALSYRPEHLIAVWPPSQMIATPFGQTELTSKDMRASLVLGTRDALDLQRTNLSAKSVNLNLGRSRQIGAETLLAAIQKTEDAQDTYHFGLELGELYLPSPSRVSLTANTVLPDKFSRARADVTVQFSAPWDRNAIEQARPQPQKIDVKLIDARWGQLELKLAGLLDVDDTGTPKGQITVKAENWRDILALGVAAQLIPEALAGPIEQGLGLLSGLSGNPRSLDLPLTFANGIVSLGPIPLGPAPNFQIR